MPEMVCTSEGQKPNDINLTPQKTMITTTIQDQFIGQVADEELSIEELKDVNGSLGILAPVVGAFAAGYAVGTVLGKATGLID